MLNSGLLNIMDERSEYVTPSGKNESISYPDVKSVQISSMGALEFSLYDGTTRSFSIDKSLRGEVADFILSLEEIEIAIIYSYRAGGIKFSVRSEDPAIHAGKLIHQALDGIGSGGGHAEMAGGSIRKDNLPKLGAFPDTAILELFIHTLEQA